MSIRTPKYGGSMVASWVDAPTLSNEQIGLLARISSDEKFSAGVQRIIDTYVTTERLNDQLTSDADNVATLADLGASVKDLHRKLSDIPARVDAHLYRFAEKMPDLQKMLIELNTCIEAAKKTIPIPKTKTATSGPRHEAARSMRALFEKFGLSFTQNPPHSKELTPRLWAAGECMKIVINRDKIQLGDQAISAYIKKASKGSI